MAAQELAQARLVQRDGPLSGVAAFGVLFWHPHVAQTRRCASVPVDGRLLVAFQQISEGQVRAVGTLRSGATALGVGMLARAAWLASL